MVKLAPILEEGTNIINKDEPLNINNMPETQKIEPKSDLDFMLNRVIKLTNTTQQHSLKSLKVEDSLEFEEQLQLLKNYLIIYKRLKNEVQKNTEIINNLINICFVSKFNQINTLQSATSLCELLEGKKSPDNIKEGIFLT